MNLKTSKLLIPLAISATLAPYYVFAVDNSRNDQITVTGNWLENTEDGEVVFNHPGARTVRSQQQIKESGSETIGDALKGSQVCRYAKVMGQGERCFLKCRGTRVNLTSFTALNDFTRWYAISRCALWSTSVVDVTIITR